MARRRPSSIYLADVEEREISWACEGYFPRGVISSLYAPRNTGKTNVVVRIAADLSRGQFMGCSHPVRRAFINTMEDDVPSVLKPRFTAADGDLSMIAATHREWRLPRDLRQIETLIITNQDRGEPFDILVLDSIQTHIPVTNQAAASEALLGLVRLAREFRLAVVLIGHLNKSKTGTAAQAMQGLGVFQAESKGLYVLGLDPDDRDNLVLTCERLGIAAPPPNLMFRLKSHGNSAALEYVGTDTVLTSDDVYRASIAPRLTGKAPTRVQTCSWFIRAEIALAGGAIDEDDLLTAAIDAGAYSRDSTYQKALKLAGAVCENGIVTIGSAE